MDVIKQYNQIGDDYVKGQESFFSEREDWGRNLMVQFASNIAGKVVIDVGCGHGPDILEYHRLGAKEVIGIDPSEKMLSKAKEKIAGKAQLILGGYENIPLDSEIADLVMGRYSMHYLESFNKAYQELSRVLKPGGLLVLLLPHPSGDYFMDKEKRTNEKDLICVPLYGEKVTVKYPVHSFEEYFSDTFFDNFLLEGFREFVQEEVRQGMVAPTAMVIKARKRK